MLCRASANERFSQQRELPLILRLFDPNSGIGLAQPVGLEPCMVLRLNLFWALVGAVDEQPFGELLPGEPLHSIGDAQSQIDQQQRFQRPSWTAEHDDRRGWAEFWNNPVLLGEPV